MKARGRPVSDRFETQARGRLWLNANPYLFSISRSPWTLAVRPGSSRPGRLGDTKTLLSQWDTSCSVQANLSRIRLENTFGKASRSRVEDILAIFRQRYLFEDGGFINALVALVQGSGCPLTPWTESSTSTPRSPTGSCTMSSPSGSCHYNIGASVTSIWGIWKDGSPLGSAWGKTTLPWSERTTTRRVAQGLLSTSP